MLEININVNAPGIVDAISVLASAIAYGKGYKGSNDSLKKEIPKITKVSEAEIAKEEAIKEEAIKEEAIKEETVKEGQASISVVEIRALVKKAAVKNRKEVKELIKEFGAENVTSLDEKHYEEFYKKVGELV